MTGISIASPGPITRLSDDIIDRILTFLTSFPSLLSLILSSKSLFYEVFKDRQRTILHAVAENILDSVSGFGPLAIASDAASTIPLVREVIYTQISKEEGKSTLQIVEGLLRKDSNDEFRKTPMEIEEIKQVPKVAFVVKFLESWFSVCYKDRTRAQSQLTLAESRRFHMSLFRMWTPFVLFADNPYKNNLNWPSTTSLDGTTVITVGRLFERFDEGTLKEMLEIFRFLGMIGNWTYRTDKKLARGHVQTARMDNNANCLPDVLVRTILASETMYFSWNEGPPRYQPGVFVFRSPRAAMAKLFKTHNVDVLFTSDMKSPVILGSDNSRVEEIQTCQRQRCMVPSYKLWSESNWFFLRGVLFLRELENCLPGRTSNNSNLQEELVKRLASPDALERMLCNMYDNENDPEGSGWDRTKFYCRNCVKLFIEEKLVSWMVRQRVEDGYEAKPDCWYGWKCRTQTHALSHANEYNHLCPPLPGKDDGL